MNTAITIVGGGLSGLLVAYRLSQNGIKFKLLEANTRVGGRILSTTTVGNGNYDGQQPAIDLGPSWFWPGQNHLANLIQELNLEQSVYLQASKGDSVMEYGDGAIVSGPGGASMAGSYRLSGGMYHMVQRLLGSLPENSVLTRALVKQVRRDASGMVTLVQLPDGVHQVHSDEVVLAVPPRVVAETIAFQPSLPNDYISTLKSIPTWMAGQAKFVAVYEEPFWRDNGLSGDALSQLGPLMEIHDASPQSGGPYALFGFVGVPAGQRRGNAEQIKTDAVEQLTRMFGERASKPCSVYLKDWASDPLTATRLDQDAPRMHAGGAQDWMTMPGHDIVWAGTESAQSSNHSNGYLEGAVEAAEWASASLVGRLGLSEQKMSSM